MDKIGKYDVVRKIGQGGFGVVYEGRDPLIKRRVAIKTCSAEDEEIRKRFFREAEIAGNLQHRHVVTVFDLGVQEGVPYLVQEYLPGEDLAHKIKRKDQLDEFTKLGYLAQVAEGLEYAHSQGVVHRDIKPANIRILDDGSVKIMDFGIAKLASAETQLTHTGMAMGTAGYLPPEQIRGEKVDLRADIFSYGVLAYELMAGRRPFQADNMSAVLFQIIGQEPPPLSSVWPACPPALENLIKKCLAKNPAERFASFTPLLAALRPIQESVKGQTVPCPRCRRTCPPRSSPPRPPRWRWRPCAPSRSGCAARSRRATSRPRSSS
jgi:serine/threonine-protein kinase